MNRIHVLVASVIVGLSAIFGLAATTKTAGIGQTRPATSQVSDQTIAARQRRLDRVQAALRRARAKKPPALPAVPAAPRAKLVAQPSPVAVSGSPRSWHEDEHEEEEGDDD